LFINSIDILRMKIYKQWHFQPHGYNISLKNQVINFSHFIPVLRVIWKVNDLPFTPITLAKKLQGTWELSHTMKQSKILSKEHLINLWRKKSNWFHNFTFHHSSFMSILWLYILLFISAILKVLLALSFKCF
jgi:hypothetical protein